MNDKPPVEDSANAEEEAAPRLDPATVVGKVLDGRYRVLRPLAWGGMGSVFLAEQVKLHRNVAVKLMLQPNAEVLERFRREAVALCEVSHPSIVEIYDFTTYEVPSGILGCLIMAYIHGVDLRDYLNAQPGKQLPQDEVVDLIRPIASALVELHANGVIHRDLKPDNIIRFVRADGRPGVKLVDFGIARRQLDEAMTAYGFVVGTPPYLAPEALVGQRQTPLSDIYALGATMFELLNGEPPFGRGSLGDVLKRAMQGLPPFPGALDSMPLGMLIRRMLSLRATDRPDALDVLHGLEPPRSVSSVLPQPSVVTAPTRGNEPTRELRRADARDLSAPAEARVDPEGTEPPRPETTEPEGRFPYPDHRNRLPGLLAAAFLLGGLLGVGVLVLMMLLLGR